MARARGNVSGDYDESEACRQQRRREDNAGCLMTLLYGIAVLAISGLLWAAKVAGATLVVRMFP